MGDMSLCVLLEQLDRAQTFYRYEVSPKRGTSLLLHTESKTRTALSTTFAKTKLGVGIPSHLMSFGD